MSVNFSLLFFLTTIHLDNWWTIREEKERFACKSGCKVYFILGVMQSLWEFHLLGEVYYFHFLGWWSNVFSVDIKWNACFTKTIYYSYLMKLCFTSFRLFLFIYASYFNVVKITFCGWKWYNGIESKSRTMFVG